MQGHTIIEKNVLVHSSTSLRQRSIKALPAIAAIFGFRVWSQDVSKAYLQSADRLMREVYMKPARELHLPEGALRKLLKPLHGHSDSGDYWNVTMVRHLKKYLMMHPKTLELSLFVRLMRGQLAGLTGMYVDDSLHVGMGEFLEETKKIEAKFRSRDRDRDKFTFAGIEVKNESESILMHQQSYALGLKPVPVDASFKLFRCAKMYLQWMVHTRPGVVSAVNRGAKVTESVFERQHIDKINSTIRRIKNSPTRGSMQC